MRLEFDPTKDAINQAKHGISLAAAADMDFDPALTVQDERRDYGESRFQVMGLIRGRLHVMIFTRRGDALRPISLKRANRREKVQHENS